MLYILFQLGPDRYALEAKSVVEVVPLLALKKIPQSPKGVAGIFIYRGRPVPALDLCELTFGKPARERLSTRIIVINATNAETGTQNGEQLLGLIAEHATETLRRDPKDFVDSGLNQVAQTSLLAGTETSSPATCATNNFLGPVLMDGKGIVQLLDPKKLMSANQRDLTFAPNSAE